MWGASAASTADVPRRMPSKRDRRPRASPRQSYRNLRKAQAGRLERSSTRVFARPKFALPPTSASTRRCVGRGRGGRFAGVASREPPQYGEKRPFFLPTLRVCLRRHARVAAIADGERVRGRASIRAARQDRRFMTAARRVSTRDHSGHGGASTSARCRRPKRPHPVLELPVVGTSRDSHGSRRGELPTPEPAALAVQRQKASAEIVPMAPSPLCLG
jgi:hypothetical protein